MSTLFSKLNPFSKKEVTISEGKTEVKEPSDQPHKKEDEGRAVLKASLTSTPYPNRKWEIDELKKASQQADSLIFDLEMDDCDNLVFKLLGKGKKKINYTLFIPENYPKGDFTLFSEDDTREFGKGTIFSVMAKIIQDQAKKLGVAAVPTIEIPQEAVAPKEEPKRKLNRSMLKESGFSEISGGDDEYIDDLDDGLSGDLARKAKERIHKYLEPVRKLHGDSAGGVYADITGDVKLRVGFPVDFIDKEIAKVWQIDPNRRIVVEMLLSGPYYMDGTLPPNATVCQSWDSELESRTLDDNASFGLGWQLNSRLNDWLKLNWPPKDNNYLVDLIKFLKDRTHNCNKRCVICDASLPIQMLKPTVCDNSLCLFSYNQYGLGADLASEIRNAGQVVDLLISFTVAAAMGDIRRFNPFPNGVEAKVQKDGKVVTLDFLTNGNPDANLVRSVANKIPAVSTLQKCSDTKTLREYLDQIDPLCFPLLRWIVTSNRAHLALLESKEMVSEMKTDSQFLFLSSPPEIEKTFQDTKSKHGSFWAFHGSNFGNWHSILRTGLKNMSGTALMSTGAAYGNGIYMAPDSATSFGYAKQGSGWDNSVFKGSNLQCLCLCEVINAGYKANPYYVVPKEDHVMTRYFFIYTQYGSANVQATSLKVKPREYKTK